MINVVSFPLNDSSKFYIVTITKLNTTANNNNLLFIKFISVITIRYLYVVRLRIATLIVQKNPIGSQYSAKSVIQSWSTKITTKSWCYNLFTEQGCSLTNMSDSSSEWSKTTPSNSHINLRSTESIIDLYRDHMTPIDSTTWEEFQVNVSQITYLNLV